MKYRPELYDVLDKNGEPKTQINGINFEDPRAIISKKEYDLKLPKDLAEKVAEYKKRKNIIDYVKEEDELFKI